MNKLFYKVAALSVGLAMAVGVGVALGGQKAPVGVKAVTSTYAWGPTAKIANGTTATYNTVEWTLETGNAQNYNSGYAGNQYGTKNSPSYVTLTTTSAFSYDSKTLIKSITIYANTGGSASATLSVGGVPKTLSGSISSNSSCGGDYTQASALTFSDNTGVTGVISFTITGSSKACYFCGIEVVVDGSSQPAQQLTAPTPSFNDTTKQVTWSAIANATKYQLSVDSQSSYADATSPYDASGLTPNVSHTVYVKAIGNGTSYLDSDPGSVTFTPTPIAVTGVTLDRNSALIGISDTVTLTATVAPANAYNKNVTWSTSSSSVATVSDGVVTGVATGSATITVTTVDGSFTATCSVSVQNIETVTFDAEVDTSSSLSITKDGLQMAISNGTLNNGTDYRVYKGQTLTFTSATNILSIALECTANGAAQYGPGSFGDGAPSGYTYSGKIGTWTGSATTVTFTATDNQVRMLTVTVVREKSASATIAVPASVDLCTGATAFGVDVTAVPSGFGSGTLTYSWTTTDTSLISLSHADTATVTVIPVATGADTATATITIYGGDVAQADAVSANVTINLFDPHTVAEGLTLSGSENVYVKGIVSSVSTVSTSATYFISDDGTATSTLEVYKGKYLGNVDFSSSEQIQQGDVVVVFGNITTYNQTVEFAQNNYLVSLYRSGDTYHHVTYNANNGTGSVPTDSTDYVAGDTVTVLNGASSLTRTNHTYVGWNTAANGSGTHYNAGDTFEISSSITLYAQWSKNVPTGDYITFDFEDSSAHRADTNNNYTSSNSYSQNDVDIVTEYADSVTTGNPLNGVANIVGRVAKNTTNSPSVVIGPLSTNDTIQKITYVVDGVSSMSLTVAYSTNGTDYTTLDTISSIPSKLSDRLISDINLSANGLYLKWSASVQSQTTGNRDFRLDDIEIIFEDDSYVAADFAAEFLATLSTGQNHVCSADGNTTLGALVTAWGTLAGKYDDLSLADKAIFAGGLPSESGNDIQKTIALYDYIATKYGHNLETQTLANFDFMGRNITPRSNARIAIFGQNIADSDTTLIVIIASVLAVAAVGGYFFLRRKKEQ